MTSPALQEVVALLGCPAAGTPAQYLFERMIAATGLDWQFVTLDVPPELEAQAKGAIAMMSQAAQPVARGGQPTDIAEAVLFLCSEAAGFVNGTSIIVDGGLTIGPRHSWDPEVPDLFEALRQMKAAAEAAA